MVSIASAIGRISLSRASLAPASDFFASSRSTASCSDPHPHGPQPPTSSLQPHLGDGGLRALQPGVQSNLAHWGPGRFRIPLVTLAPGRDRRDTSGPLQATACSMYRCVVGGLT